MVKKNTKDFYINKFYVITKHDHINYDHVVLLLYKILKLVNITMGGCFCIKNKNDLKLFLFILLPSGVRRTHYYYIVIYLLILLLFIMCCVFFWRSFFFKKKSCI
jgi:hypothetical protein